MNSISCFSKRFNLPVLPPRAAMVVLCLAVALSVKGDGASAPTGKTFGSPEEAVKALGTAVNNRDTNALAAIFGPRIDDIKSPDPVEAQNEVTEFAERFNATNHIDRAEKGRAILEVGEDRWPFAVPIAQKGTAWFFDTAAGKEELLNRRVGRDELDALKSVRAYVDAQREYASKDRDGDQVLEYAQKMKSTPGKKDGLYWEADDEGEESPLGPLLVEAQSQGYVKRTGTENGPQPFHGYFFKILTQQGNHAAGGAYNYIINGNMIGGFGLVAWPADYDNSGRMTFIINQQGKVYQKDLGPDTDALVKNMKAYDPGPGWTPSRD